MSSDRFLEQVRVRFDASVAKSIVSAFRQEPLLWKSISDSTTTDAWLKYAGSSKHLWIPGHYALFTTSQDLVSDEPSATLNSILIKAQTVLNSIRMTGLPPGNLADATGLALLIKDFNLNHPDWQGLHGLLQDKRNNLSIWKSAFAILPALMPDLEGFIACLLKEAQNSLLPSYVDLITHALFSVPLDETERLNQLDGFFCDVDRSIQLLVLENVANRESPMLAKLLASRFITDDEDHQVIGKKEVGSDVVKNYQELAEMHRLAGQSDQATQAIQLAYDALNQNHAGALRDLALELEHNQPEEARRTWEEIVRLVPDNEQYRREYAEFLIKLGETEYGLELLNPDQPSADTSVLSLRYPKLREKVSLDHTSLKNLLKTPLKNESRFSNQSDYLMAAKEAFNQKDFQLANEFIQKALIEDPNNLPVIRLNSEIQQRLADVEQAIESSALLSLFEPENTNNKKDLANLYLQTQQPEKALGIYHELVTNTDTPNRLDLLIYADIAIKSGKSELAIPVAEGFLAQDNLDGEALVTLVNAWLASGEREKAVNLLNQTSTLAPERPESWLSLAQLWTSMGNTEQAIESLRKAKAALPDNPGILLALGNLYLGNQKTTEAIAALKQAHQSEPDNRKVSIALAKAYLSHGYFDDAWMTIRPFEQDFSSDPELALILGKTMVVLGDPDSAKVMLKFAWQAMPSNEALEAYVSFILLQNDQRGMLDAHSTRELSQLVSIMYQKLAANYNFDLSLLHADALTALNESQAAYQAYLSLLDQPEAKTPVTYHHLQLQLGRIALKLGLPDVSIASLQEASLTDPDDLLTKHVLANAYLKSGLHAEAFNTARSVFKMEPNNLANLQWYCDFMAVNDNADEAVQVLEDALRLRPQEKSLYLSLAKIYSANGQKAETRATLTKLLALENISTEEYINVANLYLHLNEPVEAQQIISKAISDNPDPDFQETRDLAYSVLSFGDPAAAAALLDQISSTPEDRDMIILRADVLTANKQFLQAYELIAPVLKETEFESSQLPASSPHNLVPGFLPFSRDGLNHRAALLLQLTGDFQAAKRYADSMSMQDSGLVIDLQAQIAFATGSFTNFADALMDSGATQTAREQSHRMTKLLVLNAMISGDQIQVQLYREHLLEKESRRIFDNAVESWLRNFTLLDSQDTGWLNKLLDEAVAEQQKGAFKPMAYLEFIWEVTAVALAAWEAENWNLASKAFAIALSESPIMPVINKTYANYLVDKTRVANQAQNLGVEVHAPKAEKTDETDQELHEKQVSLAGRFIPANEMLATLKLGQAVFASHWNELDELNQLVKNGRQASQALMVITQPDLARQLVNAFPEDSRVLFQNALNHLHDAPESSLKIARQLVSADPKNPWYHALVAFAQETTDPQGAVAAMESALELWPDENGWHVITASLLESVEDYAKAAKHLETALQNNPKNALYWQLLGDVKVKEKDYHAAKDYFAKATELFPTNPAALESLAKINQRLGEPQIALNILEKAAKLDPDNPAYEESIAELLLTREDYQAAILQADQVLSKHPTREKALIVKIKSLKSLGRPEEAQRVNDSAKSVVTDPVPFELLSLELDYGKNELAKLSSSTKLVESYPEDVRVLNDLATRQLAAGLLSDANETLQKGLAIDDTEPQILMLFGKVNHKQGNLDQAIAKLSLAIRYDPSLMEAYLEMGQTYQDRREVDKAIDTYKKAIEMVSSDPRPYIHLATAYKDSRDYKNAEEMFRKAAQISPNDPSIRRQLAAIVALNLVTNLQEASKRR